MPRCGHNPGCELGGEGSLGCGVGTGYLHRIPIVTANSSKDKSTSRKTDVEVGDNSLVSEFSNLNILPMSPKKVSNDKPGETQPIAVPTQNIIQQEIPSRPIESLVPSLTAQEPYLPSVQDMNRGQEQEKRSPIPTALKRICSQPISPQTRSYRLPLASLLPHQSISTWKFLTVHSFTPSNQFTHQNPSSNQCQTPSRPHSLATLPHRLLPLKK